ncbi:MAG TPA: hypothetical protein VFC38_10365 [Stellaceae bacterium]|nr:hypothetical protein [Stellaceae bacterium]
MPGLNPSAIRLMIGTPTSDATVTTAYLHSVVKSAALFGKLGLHYSLITASGAAVDIARNRLVARFMSEPDLTHLLFIDEDHGWDAGLIVKLLEADRDVIGIAYRRKRDARHWAVNLGTRPGTMENGLLEVAELGSGFLLIRRAAFARMFASYPELKINDTADDVTPAMAPHYYALFQNCHIDGNYYSEDYAFCVRWRKLGGRVFIDPSCGISHIGAHDYAGTIAQDIVPAGDQAR